MSSGDRATTPPEIFAAKCRSVSHMEDRDKEEEEEMRKLIDRSTSKMKLQTSNEDLKAKERKSAVSKTADREKLTRTASCRVPGSVRK
ncbi:hypothetical protein HDU84_005503 [Entophlyctis sp. JEL0112]|nr:hypothetical protein HDU84_005503 [Entophlyctis sp. JEL0112]